MCSWLLGQGTEELSLYLLPLVCCQRQVLSSVDFCSSLIQLLTLTECSQRTHSLVSKSTLVQIDLLLLGLYACEQPTLCSLQWIWVRAPVVEVGGAGGAGTWARGSIAPAAALSFPNTSPASSKASRTPFRPPSATPSSWLVTTQYIGSAEVWPRLLCRVTGSSFLFAEI